MNFDLIYEWLDLPRGGWPPTKDDLFGDISSLSKKDAEEKFLSSMSILREYQLAHPELATAGLNTLSDLYSDVVEDINKRNQAASERANSELLLSPKSDPDSTELVDPEPPVSDNSLSEEPLPPVQVSSSRQDFSSNNPESQIATNGRQEAASQPLIPEARFIEAGDKSSSERLEPPVPVAAFSRGSDLEPPVAPLDTNAPLPPDMPLTSLPEGDELIEPEMAKENSGSSNFFSGLADAINFPTLSGIKSDITNWMHAGVSFDSSPARNISGGDDFNLSDATNGLDLSELISLMEENNNLLGEIVDIMSPSNSPSLYDSKQ